MKQNKYNYLLVIQQNYGNAWEDVSEYQTNSNGVVKDKRLFHNDKKGYLELGYSTRIIFRKELNVINETLTK
jgi:hypothetical protein